MGENELTETNGSGIIPLNTENIPEIIAGRIDDISRLEEEVTNSEESAKRAMQYVGGQMQRYEEKKLGLFHYRKGNTEDIIEDTQEAVEKLASAQQVSVRALKKSFEFQKKLAETSKYLFELGCANITINRIAVRAIEAKLNGASQGQISTLARQEMMNVVRQLKEQEDILKKQEFLTSKVKEIVSRLDEKDSLDKAQSDAIQKNTEDIQKLFEYIKQNGMPSSDGGGKVNPALPAGCGDISQKSRLVSLLFCLFLGLLGAHRFYCRKIVTGLLYAGLFVFVFFFFFADSKNEVLGATATVTMLVLPLLVIIDLVRIAVGKFKDGKKLYVKKWRT